MYFPQLALRIDGTDYAMDRLYKVTEARLGSLLACAEWRNITTDGPDGGTRESDEHRQIARLS